MTDTRDEAIIDDCLPVTAADMALMRNVEEYGDFFVCSPLASSIDRLIALGLAECVRLPHREYRLTPQGRAMIQAGG